MPPKKVYKKLDPITHILERSDMYVGSKRLKNIEEYIATKDEDIFKILKKYINSSPAILRIFVEVLSNAIDNVERSKNTKTPCTTIKVNIDKETGETSVWNDGDIIPIEIHEEEKIYNHSLIFGNLMAGSNYNDEEERLVAGRNGLGSKCQIFGTKIPCFDGTIKNVEDIKIGDILIGDDGKKREVLNTIYGFGEMYEVSQSRGDPYIVNSEHIISLRMPDHKVIFWSTEKQGWQMVYLDAKNQKIHSKSIRALKSPGIECPECGIILSSNLNRHYRRIHKDKEIPKTIRKSPNVNPPNDCEEVRNAYIEMENFAKTITDDNTIDISIQDYLKSHDTFKSRLTGFKSECVQWERKEVYLDPYVLGLWLGDGSQHGRGFAINAEDDYEILEYLKKWGKKNDANFTNMPTCKNCKENKYDPNFIPCKTCAGFSISSIENYGKMHKAPLRNLLKKYDLLKEKFIPIEYKVNDRDTRLKVLAGLIDSDGHVHKERDGRRINISQGMMHEKLANDILYLARSLGFSASKIIRDVTWIYKDERRSGKCISINISGNGLEDIPTILSRKKCASPLRHEVLNTGPIKVKKVENGKFVGLTIDGNERFVINDFTVTHNCTNVFSTKFSVKGLDPNNGKVLEQTWTNNMRNTTEPKITSTKLKTGFTKVTYFPDFKQFDLEEYSDDIISLYTKYIIDTAMLTKIKVYLNEELIPVNSLETYSELYDTPTDEKLFIKNKNSEVLICPANINEFQHISFVNGTYTRLGGIHVDAWSEVVFRPLVEKFNKKDKPQLNIKDIKQFFRIFVVVTIPNPEFSSQDKEKLEAPKINVEVKQADINKILKWSVIEEINDIIKMKEMVVLKKTEKKKKGYTKIEGLDPANNAGGKLGYQCSLILCEGLSAKTYAVAGIQKGVYDKSGRDFFGVMPLRGKLLNCRNSIPTTIAKNKVITDLIQALNLRHDLDYTEDNNYKTLSYGKVILLTDADCFTDDTALLVKINNKVSIIQIQNLFDKTINIDTQLINEIQVWSDTQWIPIKAIRQKKTSKRILTVNIYSGIVRCTEDHTFLLENGEEIKAKDIKIGDRLLRNRRVNNIPKINNKMSLEDIKSVCKSLQCFKNSTMYNKNDLINNCNNELQYCSEYKQPSIDFYNITEDEAWVWGFFFADGSCGIYNFEKDRKNQTKINTEKSRERWKKWIQIHTNNVNKYNVELKELKANKNKYGRISEKLKNSKIMLKNAIKNSNRISKELKPTLLRTGYSYYISNCVYDKLKKALDIMKNIYDYNWTIVEITVKENQQKAFKLILNGGKSTEHFISSMRNRFYTIDKLKKVPDEILNNNTKVQKAFLDGYYDGDGFRWLKENKNSEGFDILGQVGAQGLCYIAERLGYCYNIKEKKDKSDVFTINISQRFRRFYPGVVKDVYETKYENRFVYDIETETGRINAGIGNMIQRQCDGLHISGLLMNFFHYLFPSLLEREDPFVVSMCTPIVRVFNPKGDMLFYDENKFREFAKEQERQNKTFKSKYYKGLGTTKPEDVPDTFGLKMVEYINDDNSTTNMNKIFHKKFADTRKDWLANYDPNPTFSLDDEGETVDMEISSFLNTEVIKFSHNDCKRSIPCLFDGLKESQRKVLFAVKKRNLTYNKQSLKVAQLGGYVAEHTNYHHGEQNLFETIINMAQDYVGSNNIPLFYRDGMMGTRLVGGKDSASPRYIFTKMESITPLIFREEDDVLLDYVVDDGDVVEPKFYIPIIPMILVNGALGIGSGWSSSIPCYNPLDIIECIKIWLNNDGEVLLKDPDDGTLLSMFPEITPWYRGFEGTIEKIDTKYVTYGIIEKNKDKVEVTELPIGMWTDKFKETAEDWLVDKKIKSMKNYSTPRKVNFIITESDDGFSCNLNNMGLYSYLHTTNMVLFNEKDQLKKYNIDEILNDFCIMRYSFYVKRKKHIISSLEKDLRHLGNKERFIQEIIDAKLKIMNVQEEVIVKELEKRNYDKENKNDSDDSENKNGYNYLLKLPVRSLTSEQVKKIKNEILSLKTKLDNIIKTSEKQMWINDLKEFEDEYHKWLKIMSQNKGEVKKNKK